MDGVPLLEAQFVCHCSSFLKGVRVFVEEPTTYGLRYITTCGPNVPIKCATVIKYLLFCVPDASNDTVSSVRRVELYSLINPRECIGAVDVPDIVLSLGGSPQGLVVVTAFAVLWYSPVETFRGDAVPLAALGYWTQGGLGD